MTPGALSTLATAYWPAATLIAAVELNLFDALADAPRPNDVIAADLGVPADRLDHLLDALTAMRLLTKSPAGYALDVDARKLLCRASPGCMLDALRYNADLYRHWSSLADVVRGGATSFGAMQLGGDPASTRRFVLGMEAKARAFAPAIVAALDPGNAHTVLDVGAGPGTLSRLLLNDRPVLRATLLDLPPVLEIAQELWATDPARERATFHPADYRTDPLPGRFDAAIFAGALHQETPASAAGLLGRLRHALTPGGKLFVIDIMLDDDRTGPAFSAMFQLNMMLLRPQARVFGIGEVRDAFGRAGFDGVQEREIDQTPYCMVSGTVPAGAV